MKNTIGQFSREVKGGVALEFAIIAPVLFLFLFGFIEYGRLYFIRSNMQYAADEAGRFAMVHATAQPRVIANEAKQHLTLDPEAVEIAIEHQKIDNKTYRQISLSYLFSSPLIEWLNLEPIALKTDTQVPIPPQAFNLAETEPES